MGSGYHRPTIFTLRRPDYHVFDIEKTACTLPIAARRTAGMNGSPGEVESIHQ